MTVQAARRVASLACWLLGSWTGTNLRVKPPVMWDPACQSREHTWSPARSSLCLSKTTSGDLSLGLCALAEMAPRCGSVGSAMAQQDAEAMVCDLPVLSCQPCFGVTGSRVAGCPVTK